MANRTGKFNRLILIALAWLSLAGSAIATNRTDDFNRSDAAIGTPSDGGSDWVTDGGSTWNVNSNRAFCAGAEGGAVLESSISDVTVSVRVKSLGSFDGPLGRYTDASNNFRIFYTSTNIKLYKYSTAGGGEQIGSTYTGTVAVDDMIALVMNGSSLTVTQNGTTRITATDSFNSTATKHGLRSASNALFDDFSITAYAVATPTATLLRTLPSGIAMYGTTGTGGTPPFTQIWQRSTDAATGFSNLSNGGGVSGATTLSLVDGSAAAGTIYFYRLVVTDSLSATFTSNIEGSVLGKAPAYVLVIGDSVAVGVGVDSPYVTFLAAVKKIGGVRDSIVYNAAEGGLSTASFYDSTDTGSEVDSRLSTASANGITAGCTTAVIDLGINDAYGGRSTAAYKANLLGIANYLLGQGYTKVVVNYPNGISDDGNGAPGILQDYLAKIDECDNGTTILVGDRTAYGYFLSHRATELAGGTGVHPNAVGTVSLGISRAMGWVKAVDPSSLGISSGGGGGVSRSRVVNQRYDPSWALAP